MSKIKWWQWLLITIPPIIGVYFIVKSLKKADTNVKKGDPKVNEEKKDKATKDVVKAASSCTFPIKKGSPKSDCVTVLQNVLMDVYENPLPKYGADGFFGDETIAALMFDVKKDIIYSKEDLQATIDLLYKKQAEYVDDRLSAPNPFIDSTYDFLGIGKK